MLTVSVMVTAVVLFVVFRLFPVVMFRSSSGTIIDPISVRIIQQFDIFIPTPGLFSLFVRLPPFIIKRGDQEGEQQE